MKKTMSLLLAALLLFAMPAWAEREYLVDENWTYVGNAEAGITFPVPKDYESVELGEAEKAAGYVLFGGDAYFMAQMQRYTPDVVTYEQFKDVMVNEGGVNGATRMDEDYEVFVFTHPDPVAGQELAGVITEGLDGSVYRLSIFAGPSGAADDTQAMQIAQVIGIYLVHMDFSEWEREQAS